jgi:LPS sulfotransferase NodH
MVKFVILTTQRSGSTLLWRYLDGHPYISAHGELFLQSLKRSDSYKTYRTMSLKRRILHTLNRKYLVRAYLGELFAPDDKTHAVGFKLMYNQVFPSLAAWIRENNVRIIHLIRKNVLKTILSSETARKRKLHHAGHDTSIVPVKVVVDPEKVVKQIERVLAEMAFFKRHFELLPTLEITYEEFVAQRELIAQRIFDFIEATHVTGLPVPLKKINPDSVEDLVENYEELKKALLGTPYECFLY